MTGAGARPVVRNRVHLLLAVTGGIGLAAAAFLSHAPNRLLSGRPIALADAVAGDGRLAVLLPALVLLAAPFLPQRRAILAVVAAAAVLLVAALLWLAGDHAAALAATAPPAARTSFGAGFWLAQAAALLLLADTLRRLALPPAAAIIFGAVPAGLAAVLFAGGWLDQLSIIREYHTRQDVFDAALGRHCLIVAAALLPTLIAGLPLGVAAHRRPWLRGPLFAVLNVVQTIPSIALFGLLITPLSALAAALPWLGRHGISGIGLAPAVIALTFYSLLPVVRNTFQGLDAVPAAALEAARGIGMSRGQVFRQVELPLALPVILSGVRITLVQAIGLTAVAALIGAGGLGAIMFQGLFANALDLVLLGAVPVILLAVAADAAFRLFSSLVTTAKEAATP